MTRALLAAVVLLGGPAAAAPPSPGVDWTAGVVRVLGVGTPRILSPTGSLLERDAVELAREDAFARLGARPLARIAGLGLLNRSLIAVHMTELNDAEIEHCARAGVSVVHCPESNLKLASGFCPVAKLQAAGVNVALGTDGCASNNDLDMFGEMRTAALLAKGVAGDARAVDAPTALRMATLNGARALGWEERIGSIEPGKWADLTAVDLDPIETQPVYHVVSQLVYAANRRQVSDVWIAGERRLVQGEVAGMDMAALRANAQRWARLIAAPEPQ